VDFVDETGLGLQDIPGSVGYQHPEYKRRLWWWQFWDASYKGGIDYQKPQRITIEFQYPNLGPRRDDRGVIISGDPTSTVTGQTTDRYPSFLFRFDRESAWEYENRRKRASYLNFTKPIVNLVVSHTLKTAPVRDGPEELKTFWSAVDQRRLTSMDQWIRGAARRANYLGLWYACADVDTKDGDGKPYIYGVSPLDILDWQTDEDGQFIWLKQFIFSDETRDWSQPYKARPLFRLWTRDTVVTMDRTGKPVDTERKHEFGRVPFEPVYSLTGKDEDYSFPAATPYAADIAKMNNRVFNYDSLIDQLAYEQVFSQLIIPDESGQIDDVQLGIKRAFAFNPGAAGGEPKFIAPDPQQLLSLLEAKRDTIEQARQAAGTGRGRQEASQQKSSGEALALETEDKRSLLGDCADELQDAEIRVANLVLSYRTGAAAAKPAKPTVQYSRQFDMRTFKERVDEVLSFRSVGLPVPVDKAVKRRLVRQYFEDQNATQAELDEMTAAVDAMPDQEPTPPADGAQPPGAGQPGGLTTSDGAARSRPKGAPAANTAG
jgi:hypothetical protein